MRGFSSVRHRDYKVSATARPFITQQADGPLTRILVADPPPFALLHRPDSSLGPGAVEMLIGEVVDVHHLADLPLDNGISLSTSRHDVLAIVPYRQVMERGFACVDDAEPIRVIVVREQGSMGVADASRRIPDTPIELVKPKFHPDDETYAAIIRRVINDDIGNGAGSNFVIKRTFAAEIRDYSVRHALTIFRRLLLSEVGAYWTFIVHTGSRTFVGATPERHVTLAEGTAVMNPISGTYRYSQSPLRLPELMDFLADRKETDELSMVVDEELKMMARICGSGGFIVGPYLREMAQLAHTEYLIKGRSSLDPREILRETMFAPTVTGSPIENACRVIAHREPGGRGYYGGAVALIGRDRAGRRTLDSSILIRTADINRLGRLRIGVGATLVRLSDPESEVAETRAKAAGLLSVLGVDADPGASRSTRDRPATRAHPRYARHPQVRSALTARNSTLARFWLQSEGTRDHVHHLLSGLRVLVVDAEDTFTAMLSQCLRALGLVVFIHPYSRVPALNGWDLVVSGPGPGDPRDVADSKNRVLRQLIGRLLQERRPFLAVCLSHQILASLLGLELICRRVPNQGVQLEIDLFGRPEHVGFYNTFTARCGSDLIHATDFPVTAEVSRDGRTEEVYALRSERFASVQFHPESVLTQNGPAILAELLVPLIAPSLREAR